MIKYVTVYVISVFVASVSQILLKKSTENKHDTILDEYLNLYVITGYFMLLLSSMMTVYALRMVPLTKGPVIEALGYIFVSIMGICFLNEKINKKTCIGILLIIIGIIISCI